jgi:hypothetical protein
MWNFVNNIPRDSLDAWFRVLTFLSIGLPIIGAIMGGICGWGAFKVSDRISDLQAIALKQAQETAAEAKGFAKLRRLPPETVAKMLPAARQFCPQIKRVPVTAANGNQEAQTYASDFVNVFKDAGCEADLQLPIPGLTPDVQGLFIGVRTLADIPVEVGLIDKVLLAGGIRYEVRPLTPDFFPNEPFVFIVGAKPPPALSD